MKFGPVPIEKAVGAILAHSKPVEGGVLKKGSVLTEQTCAALAQTGAKTVTVARLEPGDVHENDAALALAQAIVQDPGVQGIRLSGAGTGRVNLYATRPGLLQITPDALEAANRIDPMITVATLPRWDRVEPGRMIATIKIIAYAVTAQILSQVNQIAQDALNIKSAVYGSATLIETQTGPQRAPDKGRKAIATRLERLGVRLDPEIRVAHKTAPLAGALWDAKADVILILTGSATSDPADVAPAALRAAGGTVERFGMPVDPGNLLFLGNLKGKPVIGLPGCARSLALNGADWVLERVLCGVPVSSDDIAGMAVGGLLKDSPNRPVPRRKIETDQT
ncbi:MAG: molybdopterin-binding protein [Paracoccaceae bacterium]